jgi:hypothetical protein
MSLRLSHGLGLLALLVTGQPVLALLDEDDTAILHCHLLSRSRVFLKKNGMRENDGATLG